MDRNERKVIIHFFQARQYQQNDGLSAWRMYFVANEWIKLSIKRKSSIGIQILMVLLTIIVCAAESEQKFNQPKFKSFFIFLDFQFRLVVSFYI